MGNVSKLNPFLFFPTHRSKFTGGLGELSVGGAEGGARGAFDFPREGLAPLLQLVAARDLVQPGPLQKQDTGSTKKEDGSGQGGVPRRVRRPACS